MSIKDVVATNIKHYRKDMRKLTQTQLAEFAGIHLRTFVRAESGEENQSLSTLESIAKALNIPVMELFREPSQRTKPSPAEALEVIADLVQKASDTVAK